ncbi:MAG: aminotransferase class I/II-fold pyridoxal phosphate-dependent enzyme [Janthinobacterium lividum]
MSKNQYQDLKKMMALSEPAWTAATHGGLVDLPVRHLDGPYLSTAGAGFVNMCSCSYLGWDKHPAILEGAVKGIRDAGTLHLTTARCRLFLDLLGSFEERLGAQFGGHATAYNSCAAASSACLPILASGALTGGVKPVMAFDRFAHFSLSQMKPLCGDETEVVTIASNDMQALAALCREHPQVAYVSDATYSVRGFADISALLALQQRYGLFLYLDDSHGLSITGSRGEGYALSRLGTLDERTIVVASLAKAFGATGGVLLSGSTATKRLLVRYGNAWSQYINSAGIGGGMAALDLHASDELPAAQAGWSENLQILDQHFPSLDAAASSPIRIVNLKDPETAVKVAAQLMELGFYTSAVFFPVVPRNTAGLRIMPRADIPQETMRDFCSALASVCNE